MLRSFAAASQIFVSRVTHAPVQAARRVEREHAAEGEPASRLARMEERLGVRLFHRSTRSITLTAEGALFLERCRRIFSVIEAAELQLSQTHEAPRGTLLVSLPLVGMPMVPTLVAFMRAYPEKILDLDFSDRVVDVIGEGFDAVVRFAEVGDSRLMSRALGTYRRRLVAAPAYLATKGVPLIPDDLKAHACLHQSFRPAESLSGGRSGPSMPASRPNRPGQPSQVRSSR